MTTNSPNRDAQAHQMPVLTEQQCEDALKVALRMAANNSIPSLNDHRYSQLFAEIALAVLTAKPVGWTDTQELRDVEKDGCGYLFTANPITPNADERRVIMLYTTPPAQFLRPVQLPNLLQPGADGYDDWYVHSSEDGEYMKADDVIAALEAAGVPYEVKS
ncbi:hypothetical protein [Pantoea ananatis]|uniref:hypothetical protein n=1 Tax=Pantoea ananas TaxID=553 RepID=UPI001B3174F5|nr:hypothetical protein [Pantoea ananatis]